MKLIIVLCFLIAGCDVLNEPPKLSRIGIAGYEYCLNNPKEKLYAGDEIYNCEYYLLRYKFLYENTMKGIK
jgi:hypothetical protein